MYCDIVSEYDRKSKKWLGDTIATTWTNGAPSDHSKEIGHFENTTWQFHFPLDSM